MADQKDEPVVLPQIAVNPSAIRALILMLIRVSLIVITALGTIAAFVKTRDLAGFIVWVKSDDFASFLFAAGTLLSLAASLWATLSRKWREIYLARHVDDKIAVVVDTKAPAAPARAEP